MKSLRLFSLVLVSAILTGASVAKAEDTGVPATYPLKKCVISDEKLGEHGKPLKVTTPDGVDVYLCCKSCIKDFKKDPAKYGKMVKDAEPKK